MKKLMACYTLFGAAMLFTPAISAQSTIASAAAPKSAAATRTAGGKPDFTGIYQWPTALPGSERGKGSATIFDRKNFAPLKPDGEAFLYGFTTEGQKIEWMRANPLVCVELDEVENFDQWTSIVVSEGTRNCRNCRAPPNLTRSNATTNQGKPWSARRR